MATENVLYNTISTNNDRYYSRQITRKFETAWSSPWSMSSESDSSNT